MSAGEAEEVEDARRALLALPDDERRLIEDDLYALIPKLRGEARELVREVLRAWRPNEQARTSTTSASPVRRARGYYRLGALAMSDRRDEVLNGLHDRDFTARRTAMLALANFPDPHVVDKMLVAAAAEPRLRQDFLSGVDQIGDLAAAVMAAHLQDPDSSEPGPEQRLAAEALGLVGGHRSRIALEACLKEPDEELRIAALYSLGQLGNPISIAGIASQLSDESSGVRRASVVAAGMIGGPASLLALEIGLDDEDLEVARSAATALRRSGTRGRAALHKVDVPVAHEALALAGLRPS
ncbi:MAG: HEAT repeat domain-containing protein [Nocardioides sp.]